MFILSNQVNHPDHYMQGKIECIEAMESAMSSEGFRGYCKGNIIKYLWRYESKGNPIQDLLKAQWYLERLIKHHEAES